MAAMRAGFRFVPADEELISYLRRKQNGMVIGCDDYPLREEQLYGAKATPWNLFGDDDPRWVDSEKKKTLYVFCNPARVGCSSSNMRISRVAGCGTWLGKSLAQDVKDCEGRIVGTKRSFTFRPQQRFKSEMKKGVRWIMHQLSVEGCNEVVCRITKHMTAASGTEDDDEPQICLKRKSKEEDSTSGQLKKKVCVGDSNDLPIIILDESENESESEGESQEEEGEGMEKVWGECCDDLIDISFLDESEEEFMLNSSCLSLELMDGQDEMMMMSKGGTEYWTTSAYVDDAAAAAATAYDQDFSSIINWDRIHHHQNEEEEDKLIESCQQSPPPDHIMELPALVMEMNEEEVERIVEREWTSYLCSALSPFLRAVRPPVEMKNGSMYK